LLDNGVVSICDWFPKVTRVSLRAGDGTEVVAHMIGVVLAR